MSHKDPYDWWLSAIEARQNDSSEDNWLVMLYLAGDNNLTEEMVLALQTIKDAGQLTGDKIVAQFDPSGLGLPTQRYDLSDKKGLHLRDHLVPGFPIDETNTGNPEALSGFVTWAHGGYGAVTQRNLLVLSGHGSGTTEDFLLRDENSVDALSIDELGQALQFATYETGKRIDILGMDACFMSMFEVCYQIRDFVEILIGAEGLEPGFGWPYGRILAKAGDWKKAAENPAHRSMDPESLAKMIVTEYVECYSDYDRSAGRSVDQAAIRLDVMKDLGDAVNALAQQLIAEVKNNHAAITLAHWYAQTYKGDQFVDLHDFCTQTKSLVQNKETQDRCDNVLKLLSGYPEGKGAIIRSGCSGFAYQHSYGLSIYFPWAVVSPDYKNLAFSKACPCWNQFLETLVAKTQRTPRAGLTYPAAPTVQPDADALGAFLATRHIENLRLHATQPDFLGVLKTSAAADAQQAGKSLEMALDGIGNVLNQPATETLINTNLRQKVASDVMASVKELSSGGQSSLPADDAVREVGRRRLLSSGVGGGGGFGGRKSRYTGEGSRYTGEGSRYTGEGSRSLEDRARAVKNLPPVIGTAYWP